MSSSTQSFKEVIQGRRRPHAGWDVLTIVVGCFLMALSFRLFLNGNEIVTGGVVGVSTILQRVLHIEPALIQWGINLPLLAFGFVALGKGEGMRSVLGSLVLPLAIMVLRPVQLITDNLMLATVFGGLLYGVGLGLVLSGRGSVGGFSLFARMIAKQGFLSVQAVIFMMDALTILVSAYIFGAEKAMFGLIAAFIMRRAIDGVLVGFTKSFMAMIISKNGEAIRHRVIEEMDRGLTILPGTGGFSGESRPVLMVVLGQAEVPQLRSLVKEEDPDAFVVLTDATEVLGKGFRRD